MADISKIMLPSGTTYNIKDEVARKITSGAIYLCGATATELTDEATTTPVKVASATTIRGTSYAANANYTPVSGDAFFYNKKEYVFDGTKWHEFGDMSGLGTLAYKDNGSVTFTPTGGVGVEMTSISGSVVISSDSGNATYIPSGTNSKPALTKGTVTSTGSFTPSGDVSLSGSSTAKVTVSKASSGTATFQPEGSVSAPTINILTAGSTTTVKNPTSKTVVTDMSVADASSTEATGELVYCSVSGETLTLKKFVETTGDSITTSNVTVKTGDAAYSASQPTFTGTNVRLETAALGYPTGGSFSGTSGSVSVTTTGAVTDVAAATFTGDTVYFDMAINPSDVSLSGSFTGTEQTVNVTFGNNS